MPLALFLALLCAALASASDLPEYTILRAGAPIAVDGTLNDETDIDSLWVAEIAIPFAAFAGYAPRLPPAQGEVWRLNLYRTGGQINLQHMAWSDTRAATPSFHVPERFGVVCFSGAPATAVEDSSWGRVKTEEP